MSEIKPFTKSYAINRIAELTQENELLKEELKRLQAENEQLKETNLQLQTIDMEIDRNNKYRKALEEIRKYIQSLNKDICNNCGWHNTDGCRPNSYVCHDLIEIQNKISEVLK